MEIIDFHCHHLPPPWQPSTARHAPASRRDMWERINRSLTSIDAATADIRSGDIDMRVLNVPAALIADESGEVPEGTHAAINDRLAEIVAASGGGLVGLASVDAFSGPAGADEAARAIGELGLRGLFVDCAKGERLLDDPAARPVLAAAARLGVPVFVHPVNPQPLWDQLSRHGRVAGLLARGTINAASLIAMIEAGLFDDLPELTVIVTGLGLSGILLEHAFAELSGARDVRAVLSRNVFADTIGLDPVMVRAAVDCLGVDNVLLGTDWPILNDQPIRARVARCLADAGLTPDEAAAVAAGNARRILSLGT